MHCKNEYQNEISFPLGGIGTGCIGLGGNGRLKDWEIFNRPAKGTLNGASHFAVKAKCGKKSYTKVLNGDLRSELNGQYTRWEIGDGYGQGPSNCTMSGYPHFKECDFIGEFPIASVKFSDEDFPGKIDLTAFNPMIPLDELNSSLPAAFFEIRLKNDTDKEIEYTVFLSVQNPFGVTKNDDVSKNGISAIKLFNPEADKNSTGYGDITVATDNKDVFLQQYWYRGFWMDPIITYWNEVSGKSEMKSRVYDDTGTIDYCTIGATVKVKPESSENVRFIISWNVPNNYCYWNPMKDENGNDVTWKNYYATVFENSTETAFYALKNWDMLYSKTKLFKDTIFSSTLDKSIIDAVSSTMSVLKSPTVLRLENGEFYGWEGVHETVGLCEGTCQHVWNYAYALCFLFPKLERSIRELEFKYSTFDSGEMSFRLRLPLGRDGERFRACLDGQMGTVIKCYRDWKISGDDEWLKNNWDNIKKILEYAWSKENSDEWDRNKDGVLEGRQHHTLDMELFGASAWLEGFYLAALKAASEMANYLGDTDKEKEYTSLYENGKKWTKDNLFNGKWFIQKIDLKDKKYTEHFDCPNYWNEETNEIMYQLGEGSDIDQLCGEWHARICGIGEIFDKKQAKTALKNMYKNNYKSTMRNYANTWRNFSINDDSGAVMCDYPEGVYKPFIPIWYSSETMHGFEYQFAGLLLSEGMTDEAITIVKSVRKKYNGKNRNPWNEIECGNNYARSMASFALLPIASGFEFDLPHKMIGFNPIVQKDNFKCFFSLGTGWGYVKITKYKVMIKLLDGKLCLSKIHLPFINTAEGLKIDSKINNFEFSNQTVVFDEIEINDCIEIMLNKALKA